MQYNTKSCCLSTCRTGNANNRETTTTSRISLDANEQSSLCLGLCLCCCCCCNMVRHMQSTQKGSVSAALEHKRKRLSDTQYTDRQAPTQTHMLIAYATLHSVCSIQVDFVSSSASGPQRCYLLPIITKQMQEQPQQNPNIAHSITLCCLKYLAVSLVCSIRD